MQICPNIMNCNAELSQTAFSEMCKDEWEHCVLISSKSFPYKWLDKLTTHEINQIKKCPRAHNCIWLVTRSQFDSLCINDWSTCPAHAWNMSWYLYKHSIVSPNIGAQRARMCVRGGVRAQLSSAILAPRMAALCTAEELGRTLINASRLNHPPVSLGRARYKLNEEPS